MNGKSVYGQVGLLAGIVLLAVTALLWSNRPGAPEPVDASSNATISLLVRAVTPTDTLLARRIEISAGATAQAALEAAAEAEGVVVGFEEFDFGSLIVRIGSVASGADGDWTYEVNDTMPPVGAFACPVQDGDRVDFHFGKKPSDSI